MTDGNDNNNGGAGGDDNGSNDSGSATIENNGGEGSSEFLQFVKPDGSFIEGWQETLKGDEYADVRATAANYKNMPDLLKSLKESKAAAMQRLDGMVRVPGENATPEEITAYQKAVGVPEAPDGYEIKAPDGVNLDDSAIGEFKTAAHAMGLTPTQVQGLVEYQLQQEATASERYQLESEETAKAGLEELKKEFGGQFDAKMNDARRGAATLGLDPDNPLFSSPEAVRAFAKIPAMVSEDKIITDGQQENKLGPESMADDILYNESNPLNKAFHDSSHPQHSEAKAAFDRYMKAAYPESKN